MLSHQAAGIFDQKMFTDDTHINAHFYIHRHKHTHRYTFYSHNANMHPPSHTHTHTHTHTRTHLSIQSLIHSPALPTCTTMESHVPVHAPRTFDIKGYIHENGFTLNSLLLNHVGSSLRVS
jgi:hypothetical protein